MLENCRVWNFRYIWANNDNVGEGDLVIGIGFSLDMPSRTIDALSFTKDRGSCCSSNYW